MHNDRLWNWFGLDKASWLTIPRALLHEMSYEWQEKFAKLLEEYDETFPYQPDVTTIVNLRDNETNKFTKTPECLLNYRHPIKSELQKLKG